MSNRLHVRPPSVLASLPEGPTTTASRPVTQAAPDTVDCAAPVACWASGEHGRAAHLVTHG